MSDPEEALAREAFAAGAFSVANEKYLDIFEQVAGEDYGPDFETWWANRRVDDRIER